MPTQKGGRRSFWWWILCSPGAAVLQLEYLFPRSVTGSFGTARRRNVLWLQFLYTLFIYALAAIAVTHPKLAAIAFLWLAGLFLLFGTFLKKILSLG
jgi:hypothetical protein